MAGPQLPQVRTVISQREVRLLFWLVLIALVAIIANLSAGVIGVLSGPAVILFVAWLLAYVLEPPVDWLVRHLPLRSRGLAVAITYLVTIIVTFAVLFSAGIALLQAAVAFVEALPAIQARVQELVQPIVDQLGLAPPADVDLAAAISTFVAENGEAIGDAVKQTIANVILVVAGLFTAVVISVGLAVSQVSLLGWLRRFLPERAYADIAALERAIAISFGGFVRGRGLIGLVFGIVVLVAALVFRVPFAPLIAVIAGMIVFIPWIGPLLGWAVLPAFALLLAPDVVIPCLVVSLIAAIAIQLVVTQLVMGRAVDMSPVAVFAVVILGTAVAGVLGAIFAIPTAAAILAITDYLRERDVLLRATDEDPVARTNDPVPAMPPGASG